MSADHVDGSSAYTTLPHIISAEKNTKRSFMDANKIISGVQKILDPATTFIAGSYTLACAMNGAFMPNDVDIYVNMNLGDFDNEIGRIISCLKAMLNGGEGFSIKRTIIQQDDTTDSVKSDYAFCDKIHAITTIKITNIPALQFVCAEFGENIIAAVNEFRHKWSDKIGSIVMLFSAVNGGAADEIATTGNGRWLDIPIYMNDVIAKKTIPCDFFANKARMQKYIQHGFTLLNEP